MELLFGMYQAASPSIGSLLDIKPLYRQVQCSAREEQVPAAMVMRSGGFAPDFQPCPIGCKDIINSMVTKAHASCALHHIDAANSRLEATHFTKHYILRVRFSTALLLDWPPCAPQPPPRAPDIAVFNSPLECYSCH